MSDVVEFCPTCGDAPVIDGNICGECGAELLTLEDVHQAQMESAAIIRALYYPELP